MTTPRTLAEFNAGCRVTVYDRPTVSRGKGTGTGGRILPTCDKPTVAHGLCEKHYADRIRLGGVQ